MACRPPGKSGKPKGAKVLESPEYLRHVADTIPAAYKALSPNMSYQTFCNRAKTCSSMTALLTPITGKGRKSRVRAALMGELSKIEAVTRGD